MSEKRPRPLCEPPAAGRPAREPDALRHRGLSVLETLAPVHDVNERCIEMLAQIARGDRPDSLALVLQLKDLLTPLTPDSRARAARRPLLLTDLQFSNVPWWRRARDHPARPVPPPIGCGDFAKPAALQLARATVLVAWHSLRSSAQSAVLLGVEPEVAEVIAGLSLSDIEILVGRRFRHVRPRWEDRPAIWRVLLSAAASTDFRKMRDFNLYSLQLATGEAWVSTNSLEKASRRPPLASPT
jgi:hypothetical protein